MPVTNRSRLKVTTRMLDAGVAALDLCREVGGHTPRTVCQAVFTAMLAESEWSPTIRKRPNVEPRLHCPCDPPGPIASYRGKMAGGYLWQAFNRQDGRHYLLNAASFPHRWIRLTDKQWCADSLLDDIQRGFYYVNPRTAVQYLKRKTLTMS